LPGINELVRLLDELAANVIRFMPLRCRPRPSKPKPKPHKAFAAKSVM
jgi:hypothetical protein